MFTSKQIVIGLVAAAGLTAGASAYAVTSQQAPQKHQLRALGLGVMSVTPATREARVVVQCGDGEGEMVTVKLPRRLDIAKLTPGVTVGAVVLTPDNLVVKLTPAAAATCDGTNLEGAAASATETMPVDTPQAPETQRAETPSTASTASVASHSSVTTAARVVHHTRPSASQRTWTFLGKAKRDDFGALSLDIDQVNLPARFVTQRYLLTDHDARMVVSRVTPIRDLAGRRISTLLLDDATVRVQAAIAAPSAWRVDDEGRRVPTIVAKRIVVLELDH
jgi:hypothetical protein